MEVENLIFHIQQTGEVNAMNEATSGVNKLGNSLRKLEKSSSIASKGIGGLLHTIGRLAKMMVLRQAIRAVMKALQEGAQNAYFFSQAMGGDLAASLDTLSTKNYTATNQIGAAWATLLQTIQPILIQIIEIVRRAAEIITQFFALLGGKTTYLKAIDYSKKWADTTAKGAKAAKEWKNQLMGFDEINRLDAPDNTTSGSASGLPNYSAMFEEAPIESWLDKWKNRIQSVVDDIKLIFSGLYDFIAGVFTGDWDRAFKGLGNIVEGFGKLISDTIQLSLGVFDGFAGQIIKIIDNLFKWIEEKTGIDLSHLREYILLELNTLRFYIEAYCIKLGWIVEDLALMISKIMQGDWQGAWEAAKKAVKDAQIDIDKMVAEMARTVTDEMLKTSSQVSQHSRSSHSSVAVASEGIANNVAGAANASADFAEVFSHNMNAVREEMISMGQSSLEVQTNGDKLSFVARVANAIVKLARFANNPGGYGMSALGKKIAGYASGGFPDDGQLFMAREGGIPEMVGTIGNRTAVATNADIVTAVSNGVYSAVVSAMGSSGGSNTPVNIYLDGSIIAKSTTKYQKQFARAGTM